MFYAKEIKHPSMSSRVVNMLDTLRKPCLEKWGNQIRTLFQQDCDDKGKQAGFPVKGVSGAYFLIRSVIL